MSETVQIKTPWLASKDPEVPSTLNYSTLSMCGRVEEMVRQYPNYIAYEFMGKTTTYAEMWQKINACAKSLKAIGIREGDKVTICMPNAPQTLCMFYAVNMVGAIANMVHPLSAESEISFYLRDSNSVAAITLDQFYPKFESCAADRCGPEICWSCWRPGGSRRCWIWRGSAPRCGMWCSLRWVLCPPDASTRPCSWRC